MDCNNYHGITLVNVPGMVFVYHLLKCNRDHQVLTERLELVGFTPNRSIIEYRPSFLSSYVNFNNTFDSVDRQTFGDLLRRLAIPVGILSPILLFYTIRMSPIKSGADVSRFFQVKYGLWNEAGMRSLPLTS